MAQYVLGVLQITNSVGTLSNGDTLAIKWDDSFNSDDNLNAGVKVYLNNVLDTTPYDLGTLGTNYKFLYGISSYEGVHLNYAISVYSFCTGSTLNWFRMNTFVPSYPYFERRQTANSPVCGSGGGAVCDIGFVGPVVITHSTDLTSNNGQVVARAESGNGDVKYALYDFDYNSGGQFPQLDSGGQLSGTITGLAPGEYTLYAKDTHDCTAKVNFTILFKPEYTEHYRFTWRKKDIVGGAPGNPRTSRVRIYEREYVGDLVEIDYGTESPLTIAKPIQGGLEDKFFTIHPTSAALGLMSMYDYQFLPLFTHDNKKFKVVYEVDEDGEGFEVLSNWFVVPSVYQESFTAAPYQAVFQLGDNLVTLQQEKYTDDNGNLINGNQKLIKVIAHVLRKTGLDLNIVSGINIFEINHSTAAEDDPLDQTYIDVACYRNKEGVPFTCWQVLEAILRPFGARVYQWRNQWILEEKDRSVAPYNYRVFDSNGDYVSNGTFDPIMDIKAPNLTNRIAMVQSDQLMQIAPAYGKITVNQNLNLVGGLPAGGFEKTDLLSPEAEIYNTNKGIFTSEEGFRDWTLRLNGTTGVSFGRVQGSTIVKGEPRNSVGAFYFDPNAWSGNLRDAYIESAAKPYEYGPGDVLNFSMDFASPAGRVKSDFIILRFAIKLGDMFLQQDLTWSEIEYVYRAYPPAKSELEKIELTFNTPQTTVRINTTIQVRIYFYARDFFDFGLPSNTTDVADGTNGITDFLALPTATINRDTIYEVRHESTFDDVTIYFRALWELMIGDQPEQDPPTAFPGGVLYPDDRASGPGYMWVLRESYTDYNELNSEFNFRSERKFYIDNVRMESLINGQAPPESSSTELIITKYVNDTLEIELYHGDCPDIINAKNMYNNYFKLFDGAPTTLWTRSGISEQLPLNQILLKVLGGQHSAPTFKLRGSFVNEFQIIGLNNTVRLTKPGSDMIFSNSEFSTDLSAWTQTGTGTAWTWTADNSGSAECTLSASNSSQKLYQSVDHSGGYVTITVNMKVVPAGNDREDVLWLVFFRGTSIVHTEKMKTFPAPTSELDYNFTYTAFVPGSVTGVGFYIRNVNGTGSCTYQMLEFDPQGSDLQEIYGITDYLFNDREDIYTLELTQISKSYISLQGTDQGGTNQGGNDTGNSFDGAYSSAYGGAFDTVLN